MTDIEKVARALCEHAIVKAYTRQDRVEELAPFRAIEVDHLWRNHIPEAQAAIAAMQPAPQKPVAWMYEIARAISTDINTGERNYTNWKQRLSTHKPCVEGSGVRNVAPLYVFHTPPVGGSDAER